ncbi:MAG: RHS repeat-associated core domain-containing protein, partial [Myxococcales bacterium]|nr:RHS repeat-associated core domain-containing protein [Myxococcales bacterium]
ARPRARPKLCWTFSPPEDSRSATRSALVFWPARISPSSLVGSSAPSPPCRPTTSSPTDVTPNQHRVLRHKSARLRQEPSPCARRGRAKPARSRAKRGTSTHLGKAGERSAAQRREHPPGWGRDGNRVRKVWEHSGLRDERIYLGAWEIYRRWNGSTKEVERETLHVMDGVRRVAIVETKTVDTGAPPFTPTPRLRLQLTNHLQTAHLEVDGTGLVISYEEMTPYGTSSYRSAASAVEVSARRYRYTGKERDEETGLDYFGARYYAPWLGRWTTADPLGLQAGLNLYLYGRASPVVMVDPNGMKAVESLPGAGEQPAVKGPAVPSARPAAPKVEAPSVAAPAETIPVEGTYERPEDITEAEAPYSDPKEIYEPGVHEDPFNDENLEAAQDLFAIIGIIGIAGATGGLALPGLAGLGLGSTSAGAVAAGLEGSVLLGATGLYEGRDPTPEEAALTIGGSLALGGLAGALGRFVGQTEGMLSQVGDDVALRTDDALGGVSKGAAKALTPTEASVKEKLTRYLLNPEHPVGGPKAKWFKEALGFEVSNADELAKQIVFDESKAVQTGVTQHGTKYNQVISITGANGRVIDVTFAWIRNNDGIVRLVTGIPAKR